MSPNNNENNTLYLTYISEGVMNDQNRILSGSKNLLSKSKIDSFNNAKQKNLTIYIPFSDVIETIKFNKKIKMILKENTRLKL